MFLHLFLLTAFASNRSNHLINDHFIHGSKNGWPRSKQNFRSASGFEYIKSRKKSVIQLSSQDKYGHSLHAFSKKYHKSNSLLHEHIKHKTYHGAKIFRRPKNRLINPISKMMSSNEENAPTSMEVNPVTIAKTTIPSGCVFNITNHIYSIDSSLASLSGKGLLERINGWLPDDEKFTSADQIHTSTRFNVLSHGNQTDPVFDYGNNAALTSFGYQLDEFVQITSKYSASIQEGFREEREKLMQDIRNFGWGIARNQIRITKQGDLFQIDKIIVWNIYDDTGIRTGQAALFDNEVVKPFLLDDNNDYTRPSHEVGQQI